MTKVRTKIATKRRYLLSSTAYKSTEIQKQALLLKLNQMSNLEEQGGFILIRFLGNYQECSLLTIENA